MRNKFLNDEINYASSFLFTPAIDLQKFDRGIKAGSDITVLDLEDSVPIDNKEIARKNILNYFSTTHLFPTAIRINKLRSQEGMKDLLLLTHIINMPDIIFLPKVEHGEEVAIIKDIIFENQKNHSLLISVIESASGAINIADIAKNSAGLILGIADYCADTKLTASWENLLYIRQKLINTAAAYKILCIDGPFFDLKDQKKLYEECVQVKSLGFYAKAAIHTSQISVINEAMSPSKSEVLKSRQILAHTLQQSGVSKMNNRMVGPPFVIRAKEILKRASVRRKHQHAA